MNFKIIIPARLKSTRFPEKPLALINGKAMIEYVYDVCAKAIGSENVFVATDSEKIVEHCNTKGIITILTSKDCLTGTDRVAEAANKVEGDIFINVQGDEPLIKAEDILKVIEFSKKHPEAVINCYCQISDQEEYFSKNIPKIVFNLNNELVYMSRAPIPFSKSGEFQKSHKQVCIYAFPREALRKFVGCKEKTPLEAIEDLELNRFVELNVPVKMLEVSSSSIAVDVPEDIQKVEAVLNQ